MDPVSHKRHLRPSVLAAGLALASIPILGLDAEAGLSWIPQVLTGGLCLALLPEFFSSDADIGIPASLIVLLGWLLAGVASIIVHPMLDPESDAFTSVVKVVLMTIVFSYVIRDKRDVEVLLWFYICSFPIVLFMNADALRGYTTEVSHTVYREADRFRSTLDNANEAALYALLVIWAAVTIVFISKNKIKWLALGTIPVAVWIVILTGSRKGFIGIPLFLLTLYWFGIRQKSSGSIFMRGVTLFAFIALTWASSELLMSTSSASRLETLFQGKMDSSADTRLDMALAGLKVFAKNPVLGVGFDNYRHVAPVYGTDISSYSHSTVIEVLSCTGAIGFLTYFGALALLLMLYYRAGSSGGSDGSRQLFHLALCLWVIFLWYNIFSVQFSERLIWPILGMLAGYAHRETRAAPSPVSSVSSRDLFVPQMSRYWPLN